MSSFGNMELEGHEVPAAVERCSEGPAEPSKSEHPFGTYEGQGPHEHAVPAAEVARAQRGVPTVMNSGRTGYGPGGQAVSPETPFRPSYGKE